MTTLALVLTPGMGVGPEVTLRALSGHALGDLALDDVVLVGRWEPLVAANQEVGLPLTRVADLSGAGEGLRVLVPAVEPVEGEAIRLAVEACLAGQAGALVTGPIHKKRLAEQGFPFPGHTDYLGVLCGVPRPVMAFVGGSLRVALVTTHLPLAAVPAAVTRARVVEVGTVAAAALQRDLGIDAPRLAVCGLNPHAGEEGLLGSEELDTIGPACADLRALGIDVTGPVSAEAAFLEAGAGRADLVVAMYHDQGLAPLKAVDFGRSVNWTLGLPIVRTSVDHGTADSLVGTGRADPASMAAAIGLARRILARR